MARANDCSPAITLEPCTIRWSAGVNVCIDSCAGCQIGKPVRKIAVAAKGNVAGDIDILAGNNALALGTRRCDRECRHDLIEPLFIDELYIVEQLHNRDWKFRVNPIVRR